MPAKSRVPLSQRLRTLARDHVEKAMFAACALALVGFLYKTVQSEVYSFTPEDLTTLAAKAEKHVIEGGGPRPPELEGPNVKFPGMPVFVYQPFFKPIYDGRPMPRTTPALFPVERLQATYGRAPFRYAPVAAAPVVPPRGPQVAPPAPPRPRLPPAQLPGAAVLNQAGPNPPGANMLAGALTAREHTEGRRYAIVTGEFPWDKQQAEFNRLSLFNRIPWAQNQLEIEGFVLERAEGTGEPVWQTLDLNPLSKEMARWSRNEPELADDSALVEGLAMPLGPRVEPWTVEEVVPEGIPTRKAAQAVPAEGQPRPQQFRLFNARIDRRIDRKRPQEAIPAAPVAETRMHPTRLFRVFDFTVEPGKQYRYRVRIVVTNPNHGVHTGFLANELVGKEPILIGPPSDATPALNTPVDWRLIAGPMTPASRTKPADVRMGVEIWDPATGAETTAVTTALMGQTINGDMKVRYRDPLSGAPQEKTLAVVTHVTVLDAEEGQPLPKEFQRRNAPRKLHSCEVLLLRGDGEMIRMSSRADRAKYLQLEKEQDIPVDGDEVREE